MTKKNSIILMLVLLVCMIFTGCTKNNPTNIAFDSDLVGFVKVENLGADTKITYTFKNQSEKKVHVIGGARYKLLKDNQVVEEGGVPIKDYIDLEPGEDYTDKKTFSNLESASYIIHVEWSKTMVSAEFVQN